MICSEPEGFLNALAHEHIRSSNRIMDVLLDGRFIFNQYNK